MLPLDLELAKKEKRVGFDRYYFLMKFVEVDDSDNERPLGWFVHSLYKNGDVNRGKFDANIF